MEGRRRGRARDHSEVEARRKRERKEREKHFKAIRVQEDVFGTFVEKQRSLGLRNHTVFLQVLLETYQNFENASYGAQKVAFAAEPEENR